MGCVSVGGYRLENRRNKMMNDDVGRYVQIRYILYCDGPIGLISSGPNYSTALYYLHYSKSINGGVTYIDSLLNIFSHPMNVSTMVLQHLLVSKFLSTNFTNKVLPPFMSYPNMC